MARLSWILPLSAWASQAFSRILLASWAPAEVHLLLMLLQGLAILAGFVIGIVALVFMWRRRNWDGRGHSIVGCTLSALTIALNAWAFIGDGAPVQDGYASESISAPSTQAVQATEKTTTPDIQMANDSTDPIFRDLRADSMETRWAAIQKVDKLENVPTNYIPILLELIQLRMDSSTEKNAVVSFGIIHTSTLLLAKAGEPAVPALRELMKKDDTRWNAVEILQRMGDPALSALPELISALDDKNEHVRYFAAKAIMQLGARAADAVPALVKHVDDPHDSARDYSIQAIGKIGTTAESALPALVKATTHQSFLTRKYARDAIEQINKAILDSKTQ